jgi:hypothetical protein
MAQTQEQCVEKLSDQTFQEALCSNHNHHYLSSALPSADFAVNNRHYLFNDKTEEEYSASGLSFGYPEGCAEYQETHSMLKTLDTFLVERTLGSVLSTQRFRYDEGVYTKEVNCHETASAGLSNVTNLVIIYRQSRQNISLK